MPEKVPPMFAAMSSDDPLSGQGGFEVVQAWQKRGVAEQHLYGLGGHNFGMGPPTFSHERQKAFSDMRAAKRL